MSFQLFLFSRNKDHFQVGFISVNTKEAHELNLKSFIPLWNFHH